MGLRAEENPCATVPLSLVITNARADMVYVNDNIYSGADWTNHSLQFSWKLTVRKSSKENYQQLLSDIEETNRKASLVTIEIGSLGHSLPTCHKSLRKTLPNIFTSSDTCKLFDDAARIAISTSYAIFLARKNLHWPTNRPLLSWLEPKSYFSFSVLLLSHCP